MASGPRLTLVGVTWYPQVLCGAIRDQFFPWTICALVAPRRFVYSYELGWNVEDLPAWARYRKVFGSTMPRSPS